MKRVRILAVLFGLTPFVLLALPACNPAHAEYGHNNGHEAHHEHQKVVTTSPLVQDVTVTQRYVCQIRSQKNVEIRALEGGYLEEIHVKEGQMVKQGEVLFRVLPTLYRAKFDAEQAEVRLAEIEYTNTEQLFKDKVVAYPEVMLKKARLDKARAQAKLASAEVDFTEVKAPFDGIIDRLQQQQGSLIKEGKEGDILTVLSDNRVMWVYFNVPEARYLDDMARRGATRRGSQIELADTGIELVLANGSKFKFDAGRFVTVEGQCDNETGNFKYRADFPNPEGLLRNGQTGNVLVHRKVTDAVVIPQRATFEILEKRYVYVVGEDHTVRQREIQIERELDDVFVIKSGVGRDDRIVLEGVRQVREGQAVEAEFLEPRKALANLKYHAE
jgi:membrane fusion protein (multidrug efflux system)